MCGANAAFAICLTGTPHGPPATTRRGGLELLRLTRLHVVPLLAKILQDPRLENLLLERLERPVQAVGLAQCDFDHLTSEAESRRARWEHDHEHKRTAGAEAVVRLHAGLPSARAVTP